MYIVGFSCVLIGLVSCFDCSLSPKIILNLINFLFDRFDCWVAFWVGFMLETFDFLVGIVVDFSSSRLIICKDWLILVLASQS